MCVCACVVRWHGAVSHFLTDTHGDDARNTPETVERAFKRAALCGGDGGIAGVKVVGDYVDNYKIGFPSELAMLN